MESLPDALVQTILSQMSNAKDVASCTCVSTRWKESLPYLKSLYFPRNLSESLATGCMTDKIVEQMVATLSHLEELVVYCPFTNAVRLRFEHVVSKLYGSDQFDGFMDFLTGLAAWLSHTRSSLRHLELRMDNLIEDPPSANNPSKLDCIATATNLESLKLWGVLMVQSPKWDVFQKLQNLEIVGARMEDSALNAALLACPNLTHLSLLACEGLRSVTIDLPKLEQCKLDFYGLGDCYLSVVSPKLVSLEVQGCSWVRLRETQQLANLSIANNSGRVYMVDFGKLVALEFLSIRGIQWCWDAISKMLQAASEVKHLYMKVEFTGDFEALLAFPEIDFVDFFNSHPKLRRFDMHGAMFAALCQKNSLKHVDSNFVIPCLEEVAITVRSPLNAEQKINTLESLIKYGKELKKMKIRILDMKSNHSSADDFFQEIWKFKCLNPRVVSIE